MGWHRASFRAYWRWKSRPLGGRPRIAADIRRLIREMSVRKPALGRSSDTRRTAQARHRCLTAMKPWLEMELGRIPGRGASLRRSATPSPAGQPFAVSWTMAVSISTTTRSNARSGRSPSDARTTCSQAPTVAALGGPPPVVSSPPQNSMTSSARDGPPPHEPSRRPPAVELGKNACQSIKTCNAATLTSEQRKR
jgi:hypothetical protein